MIHPLLLVALVVVLVASQSLVVVDVVLLRQSKVFQGERHSVDGRKCHFYGWKSLFLWMEKSLFMDGNVSFMDENVSFYG